MDILQAAYSALYDTPPPELSLSYSARFTAYNATVHITKRFGRIRQLEFRLSRSFEECDESIRIGVVQHLLNRVYGTDVKTDDQDLYHSFLRHVPRYAAKTESNPYLIEEFERLNEQYFNGLLERPNMVFGKPATTVLGHYNYTTDTVTISPVMKERPELLSFVLYHELLHKKHGHHQTATGRTMYHTRAFREDEKQFHIPDVEEQLKRFLRKKKRKFSFL